MPLRTVVSGYLNHDLPDVSDLFVRGICKGKGMKNSLFRINLYLASLTTSSPLPFCAYH